MLYQFMECFGFFNKNIFLKENVLSFKNLKLCLSLIWRQNKSVAAWSLCLELDRVLGSLKKRHLSFVAKKRHPSKFVLTSFVFLCIWQDFFYSSVFLNTSKRTSMKNSKICLEFAADLLVQESQVFLSSRMINLTFYNCDTFVTLFNCVTFQLSHFPILTLFNSNTFQF